MRKLSAQGLVVGFAAVVSTVSFILTLVLALTGATQACTWTGTIGAVLLAVWLVAINIRPRSARATTHRSRRRRRPEPTAPPAVPR